MLPVFLIATLSGTFCQKNLQPGYVINAKGKKSNGYINFLDWQRNPKAIIFRETSASSDITYTPLQVKGFFVQGKSYESAIVNVDDRPVGPEPVTYSEELHYRTDTVFLEALFQGEKSLYYYKDKDAREHFFIKQDSIFEWLVYKKYLKDVDGKTVILANDKYIKQLVDYLAGCSSINDRFLGVQYNVRDLGSLFSAYYKNCAATGLQFKRKTERIIFQKGLIAGLSTTSLNFNKAESPSLYYLTQAHFSSSQNFAGGVFFNLVIPRNLGRWSLANELLLTSFKATGIYNEQKSPDYYIINTTTFGYSQVRLNDMIRYKFPVNDFFMYLNAGLSNAFAISETNLRNKEVHKFGTTEIEEAKGLDDARTYEQGLIFGAGTQFKKYSIDLRYENGNGMSKISALNSQTNKFYLLLGYQF